MLLDIAIALLPVLLFLLALVLMDSFKLARPATIAAALAWGAAAAFASDAAYDHVMSAASVSPPVFSRYIAPILEETTKALFVAGLILRRRIGFPVDAAQLGFAAGTGFALVENVHYLRALGDAPLALWFVRGVGTAVLHGATTAIFAMVSQTAADRNQHGRVLLFAPGWACAVAVHSAFNHVPLPPVAMTLLIVAVLPLLMVLVFQHSERVTRDWVGAGLDLDIELLRLVSSADFGHTRMGSYLQQLTARFPGPVVADMLCLLRLELELSVQAKAMLLAREAGLAVPLHQDAIGALEERAYLRRSIGTTGLLALQPLHVTSGRDDWHRYLLLQRKGRMGGMGRMGGKGRTESL